MFICLASDSDDGVKTREEMELLSACGNSAFDIDTEKEVDTRRFFFRFFLYLDSVGKCLFIVNRGLVLSISFFLASRCIPHTAG